MLVVKLLGQFDVRRDGTPLVIPSRPAQSLLAFLLLNAGIPHRREKLAGLLWPETPEANARRSLRQELWRLRKALGPSPSSEGAVSYLQSDDITITFAANSESWLDAAELERGGGEGATADELMRVLSLYHGELLPGFYDEWVALERERLRAIYEEKMGRLLECLQGGQRWGAVREWAERWIGLGGSPEPAYRALMIAHHALGNVSHVAIVYDRCVRAMLDDLGVEPSEETRALFEWLSKREKIPPVSQTPATRPEPLQPARHDESKSPVLPPALPRPRRLPVPLTTFIGREGEIAQLKRLLSKTRLLTLTGAGGVGKTRLAIRLAEDLSHQYKDGAWWVDLGALSDPALVPQAVARSVGVQEVPNVPVVEQLADALCSAEGLLVLDNCEHLIAACAHLAEFLLGACGSVRMLMTSREALGMLGETIWRVPSLALPELSDAQDIENLGKSETVRLFVERAIAVRPDFALTEESAPSVTRIARRLDGIPLAIELAAARVRTLSVDQIATRLEHGFNLLKQGSRTALPHHQTLLGTMDWSYHLLSRKEQILLRRLSVFAGGFMAEAAEAVCVDAPSVPSSTASPRSPKLQDPPSDNALIQPHAAAEGKSAGDPETGEIGQGEVLDLLYSLEEKSLIEVEHRDQVRYHLLETVRQYAWDKAHEADETGRLEDRHLEFFVRMAEQAEPQLRSAEQPVWLDRLEIELDNLRHALVWALTPDRLSGGNALLGMRLAAALCQFWIVRGHLREGRQWLAQVLSHTSQGGDETTFPRAKALLTAGMLAYYHGDLPQAVPACEEGSELARALGSKWLLAIGLFLSGQCQSRYVRDFKRAEAMAGESVAIARDLGDKWLTAIALWNLGILARHQGDQMRAASLFEESLRLGREAGDPWLTAGLLDDAGSQEYIRGNYGRALALHEEGLALRRNLKDSGGIAGILHDMGRMARCQGDDARAAVLYEESLTRFRELGQKESIAVVLNSLGYAQVCRGNLPRAVALLKEGMSIFRELRIAEGVVISLAGIAVAACASGQVERAGRLFGATSHLLEAIGASIPYADRAEYDRRLGAARTLLGERAFAAVWSEGEAMPMEQAIAYALEETH